MDAGEGVEGPAEHRASAFVGLSLLGLSLVEAPERQLVVRAAAAREMRWQPLS